MLRSMCGIRPDERVGSAAVCEKLGISELGNVIAKRCLRWFGHVERSNGWINQCQKVVVEGPARRGRYQDMFINLWSKNGHLFQMVLLNFGSNYQLNQKSYPALP